MKNSIKTRFAVAALLALATVAQAAPGVGSRDFGITNTSIAAGANVTAMGQSDVTIPYNNTVTFWVTGTSIVTNASTLSFTWSRVDASGNVETIPRTTSSVSLYATGANVATPITNTFVAPIVVANTTIGTASALSLISVTNGSLGGTITSLKITVETKNLPYHN